MNQLNLQITGRHIEITEPIRDYVHQKFSKLFRHFDQITSSHVILEVQGKDHEAEAKLEISGAQVFAKTKHSNMYAALDLLTDKLDRQLLKYKEKLKNHSGQKLVITDQDEPEDI